jgi:hypothetical protein
VRNPVESVALAEPSPPLRALNHFVNPIVRLILRSRVHGLLSRSILLLTYTRRNGSERTIPVRYVQRGDVVVILVGLPEQKRWWRRLRMAAPVKVRIRGTMRTGSARALVGGGKDAEEALALYLERFPNTTLPGGARASRGADAAAALAAAAQSAVIVRVALATRPGSPAGAPESA